MTEMLNVFGANVRMVFIEMRRYLPNTVIQIVNNYVIFLAMLLTVNLIGSPTELQNRTQYIIVSNVFWFLAIMTVQSVGWQITNEATRGTLEQLYMSPLPPWFVLFSRMVGNVLVNLLTLLAMLALALITVQQWLNFDLLTILPILLFTLVSMVGTGFAIAGLAVIFKQVQSFLQFAQFILLALTFVPLSLAPWLEVAPFIKGINMVRQVLIEAKSISDFMALDWFSLVLNAVIYFLVGVYIYKQCERVAIKQGLLGQY